MDEPVVQQGVPTTEAPPAYTQPAKGILKRFRDRFTEESHQIRKGESSSKKDEKISATPSTTPDPIVANSSSDPGARIGRPPQWTQSRSRKLARLYMYTTLPMEKIIKAVFPEDDVKYVFHKSTARFAPVPNEMLTTAQEELGTEDPA